MLTNSIVSYQKRGPWGDNEWRGNMSGHLVIDLIETYQPRHVFDPMVGGGTTRDVCEQRVPPVPFLVHDIKHDGWNILKASSQRQAEAEIRELTDAQGVDLIMFHPPYWNMIMYDQDPHGLCNCTYSEYKQRMIRCLGWLGSLLSAHGRIALLLGDLRRNGRMYFLTDDVTVDSAMVARGLEKEAKLIKIQHNTLSGGDIGLPFKYVHEYVTLLKRVSANRVYSDD